MHKNFGEWCDHCGRSCMAEWDEFAEQWLCQDDYGYQDDNR